MLFRAFAAYDVKGRQVATGNEPVARDNNTILTLKPGDKTLSRLTLLIIVVKELESRT